MSEIKHSLTDAAETAINDYLDKQSDLAARRLNHANTAYELEALLTDYKTLTTPGFILRRYIQPMLERSWPEENLPDLNIEGNVRWDDKAIHYAAKYLSRHSYSDHGLEISIKDWKRYLTDGYISKYDIDEDKKDYYIRQGIRRNMLFKLSVVTQMDWKTTIDLLRASGEAPYILRDPLELIIYYFQKTPGIYSWKRIQALYDKWIESDAKTENASAAEQNNDEPEPPASVDDSVTRLIRVKVDEILESGLSFSESEKALLEFMTKNRAELKGFSHTAQSNYMRLLKYLEVLYLPEGTNSLKALISAMFGNWKFDNLYLSKKGKFVFRGETDDKGNPLRIDWPLDKILGSIALFCKRYYDDRLTRISRNNKSVDRRDVLLLSFFIIMGYENGDESKRTAFKELSNGGMSLDSRIKLMLSDLNALTFELTLRERQTLCSRLLNELLAEFDFRELYYPAPFDRLFILALLSDNPVYTIRYLTGEIM